MKALKYRDFVKNFCLVILSLSVTIGVGELYLRFIDYDPLKTLKSGRQIILQPSDNIDMKYELVPEAKGFAWGGDVEINVDGYRGMRGNPGKFIGFRAIAIGDSITFGNALPVESTYAYQLNELLNKRVSESEVLNFGIGGYDILQEVALLQQRGLKYKPDLVIVGFCLNDIGIASPNLSYIVRLNEYQSNFIQRLRLVQFITNKIDKMSIRRWMDEKNQPDIFLNDYQSKIAVIGGQEYQLRELMQATPEDRLLSWYKDENRIGRLRFSFERLSDLARKEKFAVVIVIFPKLVGDAGYYPGETAHKIVTMEAERVGFDVIDVVEKYMAIGMKNLRRSSNDLIHPNHDGHKLVAEQLEKFILSKWFGKSVEKNHSKGLKTGGS